MPAEKLLKLHRSRFLTMVEMDLRFHFTRPLFWILLVLVGFSSWWASTSGTPIRSGDTTAGGDAVAWITSEYAVAVTYAANTFLRYTLFVAVAAGMAVPRDDELRVGPVLHATRLTPGEYLWGKLTAVVVLFTSVLAIDVALSIVCNHLLPNARSELVVGPFELANYVRPVAVLNWPFIVFLCGISLAAGELTRRPILVFVAPVTLVLASLFFFWMWSPSWLDPGVDRLLMWLDPSGYRWLNETWIQVDLGVAHYNHQPVGYDLPFLASRLAYAALGIVLVAISCRHFARTLREAESGRRRRRRELESEGGASVPTVGLDERPLGELAMASRVPGFLAAAINVARFEAGSLRSHPGLYMFVPLILFMTLGMIFEVGAFDTPLLVTPGTAAAGTVNTLTLLVTLLILFYTVESLGREWATGLAPIYYACPARTAALLVGKTLANSIVGVVVLSACYLGAAIVMLLQGQVSPSVGPFLLVWGSLLLPTFVVWSSFVTAAFAATGNRYATYGIALAVMAFTGWKIHRGEVSWVGNWCLWDTVTWTDFGGLDPHGPALALNRLFWLAVAAFLVALTVRIFPRREHDSGRILDRLRPKRLLGTAWRLAPAALPAVVLGVTLGIQVSRGFQSAAAERREEEYHARNFTTWAEAEGLRIADVDLDLDLEPDEARFSVTGRYELVNRSGRPLRRFPMSVGDHFRDIEWTLEGEPFEPEDRARLHVFVLDEPLPPGETLGLGFSHEGRLPDGFTRNGGRVDQFVLPSGVVLTSFSSSFLPVPFFESDRGVDDDNRLEPKDYEDGFWEGITPPAYGFGSRFHVRTKIEGPERFAYHGVGVVASETVENGRRTVVWRTDHPVNAFNVVAGEWDVWTGEGVAIYHHPEHGYNVEEMGEALAAARKFYSEWFYPYPWKELRLNEFPALNIAAQGFATNITFSEGIGFLTRGTPRAQAAFLVTAHEAAHQWWGNVLLPGKGPGAFVLTEGMAHFSTILLFEEVKGVAARIEFSKQIERNYGNRRRVDSERPLAWIDGSKTENRTAIYDKGGWVFWMLLNHLGRDAGLAGYRHFITHYAESDDYPLVQDFVALMRRHAADPEACDDFVEQWFFDVVVPEYRFQSAEKRKAGDGWIVEATLRNVGSGRMPVEVAAVRGWRIPGWEENYREARVTVVLGGGESRSLTVPCDFEPERVLVDPDALVLMLKRGRAMAVLSGR